MLEFYNSWMATPLMALEFLAFGFLFAFRLKRSEYFYFRFIAFGLLELLTVVTVEVFFKLITGSEFHYGQEAEWDYRQTIFRFVFFFAIYAMTFFVLKLCFKAKTSTVFLIAAASFASQHIAYNIFALINVGLTNAGAPDWLVILVRTSCMFLAVAATAICNIKSGEKANPYEGNTKKKVAASSIVIVICIGLYRLNNDLPSTNDLTRIGFSFYAIVSCSLLLLLFFGLWESDKTHAEADAYRELLHTQKEQYELSKRNIDLINIKCHDLKHQIRALKTSDNEAFVKELEHEIMIYDSSLKTGNEVLDVILREKLLQCEAEGITMTCFLEGKAIDFMDEMDIYSLFGNLLSNAFESAQKFEDKEKRTIALSGRNVGNMFFLHEENYVADKPSFEGGVPKTTKKNDDDTHGFGMKSMQRIAEKYGGEMAIKCENGTFSIDFVFPLPDNS
ncbi:MAG: ATP-binding protein [Bacilli bacterium]|nr:ATP-binding protein [Bacilli bacterium]